MVRDLSRQVHIAMFQTKGQAELCKNIAANAAGHAARVELRLQTTGVGEQAPALKRRSTLEHNMTLAGLECDTQKEADHVPESSDEDEDGSRRTSKELSSRMGSKG